MAEKTRDATGAHPVTDDEVRAVVQGAARRSRGVSVPVAALWVCLAAALVAAVAIAVAGFTGAWSGGGAAGAATPADAAADAEGTEVTVSLSLPSGWPGDRAPAVPVALTGMTVGGEEVSDVLAPAPGHPRAATLAPGVYELALANGTVEVDGRVFGAETVRFSVDGSGGARDVALVLREEDGGDAGGDDAAAGSDAAADRGDADAAGTDAAGDGAADGADGGWGVSADDVDDLLDAIDRTKELVDAVSQW